MKDLNLLQRVYDATHSGLDIITDLLPAVDDAVINQKKAFRLRPDERTPSAHLYPPDQKRPYWHVKDFGMGEGGGLFSPIDLYLWDRGYGQDKFRMALEELAIFLIGNGMMQKPQQRSLERAVVAHDDVHMLIERMTKVILVIQVVDAEILDSHIAIFLVSFAKLRFIFYIRYAKNENVTIQTCFSSSFLHHPSY